jgi:multiphosphoryl transfer protein
MGSTSSVILVSPLAGWVSGLGEVPDPAFADGLLGDGIAIDPSSHQLCAPCDGLVVSVHAAAHACTVRAATGAEVLLHIGVDTVALRGEGFRALVEGGQPVRAGDPLIAFDIELVSRKARSLHVPVVLVSDGHEITERVIDREVAVGDRLLTITHTAAAAAELTGGEAAERRVQLFNAHGLHARPAAAFARRARRHAGAVTVECGARSANGKSLVALMGLGTRAGDTLTIRATGPGAEDAAGQLAELVASGLGETVVAIRPDPGGGDRADRAAVEPFRSGEENRLAGVPAAPGLAVGRAVRLAEATPDAQRDGEGAAVEHARLASALAALRGEIEASIAAAGDSAAADIFRAHLDLLDDPELVGAAGREIADGRSAAWAWRSAVDRSAAALRRLGDPLLAQRTSDLDDLGRRTLALLAGRSGCRLPAELPRDAILVADEVLPSDLAAAPPGRIVALCSAGGGPTAHAAILAAGMGAPAVVAIGDALGRVPDGAPLIVDGGRGEVRVFPAASASRAAERAVAARAERRKVALAAASEDGRTADGVRIAVMANLGRPGEVAGAVAMGAEGCGLLRTEFLFLDRSEPPSEEEQAACYQAMADALAGRPLVVRLLDAGGDKPLPYLPRQREDNPALGVRGVRLGLRQPDLLRRQLRAILRVTPASACRILVPMVAKAAELRAVRAALEEERRALAVPESIALGAMIEVPSAALMADALAREADFLSIGTNDLAQYALAMDRGNPLLAAELDALHPAVLRLIAQAVDGARACGRPVTVCGGAAGEPLAIPVLVGLGVRSLSAAPALVPVVKAALRALTVKRCEEIAATALAQEDGAAVRGLVADSWPELGEREDVSTATGSEGQPW